MLTKYDHKSDPSDSSQAGVILIPSLTFKALKDEVFPQIVELEGLPVVS